MFINEKVKSFLEPHTAKKQSSFINPTNVLNDLSDTTNANHFNDFFDYQNELGYGNFDYATTDLVQKQAEKIKAYRNCATQAEVTNAIDIIVNEIVFTYEKFPLKLQINEENEKISKAIQTAFDKIIHLGHFNKNLYDVVRRSYIDGQIVCQCVYEKGNTKKGIQKLRLIDPIGLYFDPKIQCWKYRNDIIHNSNSIYSYSNAMDEEYSVEEIVRNDFGLYNDNICLSYLEHGMKISNMLSCLEDMLIPLRFSRSISRRVFNVDIGDLPAKRGEEYMRKIQQAFKYKKFYNNETGEISNQQHITSMVEDYWFANRSGGRGTTVDTIDETGNLGEITDVLYFNKKLYRALHIPVSFLDIDDAHPFSTDATETTQEDVKFMMFVSRLRLVYCEFFKSLLKLEVISTNIMKEKDWNLREKDINVVFTNENLFIEKMKLSILQEKIEAWNSSKDIGGTIMSFKELINRVFGLNDNELETNLEQIKEEIKDKRFKKLYDDAGIDIENFTDEPKETEEPEEDLDEPKETEEPEDNLDEPNEKSKRKFTPREKSKKEPKDDSEDDIDLDFGSFEDNEKEDKSKDLDDEIPEQ